VANALQLSLSSVNRISTTRRCGVPQTSPKKTRPRRKPVTAVDETICHSRCFGIRGGYGKSAFKLAVKLSVELGYFFLSLRL
jgi:hypothetical protein